MTHPTQIFLANPQALRVEYRLDDQSLRIWWSPRAGRSADCFDRNYSSRDAHLDVFGSVVIPGCGLAGFQGCDYDPYHCVLRFAAQTLHIAVRPDRAAVLLWGERPLAVDIAAARHDGPEAAPPGVFAVRHDDPQRSFVFAAASGGGGRLRTSPRRLPAHPLYARFELDPGALLALAVGESDAPVAAQAAELAALPWAAHAAATEELLAPVVAAGRVASRAHPRLAALRDGLVRGLHSMIDESGAYRASLKPIYYLIWVRDGGFSFPFQAAAGWPHRLPEFARLLLENPTTVDEPGLPRGRMFGQLVHRRLGKLEEDGLFYAVWTLFTLWTQRGSLEGVGEADWRLIDEALAWVEAVTWDAGRGLYGEHFADETPTCGHRDDLWDHAIGQPTGWGGLSCPQGRVVRNYDVYFNVLMHSTYAMLAAMRGRPDLLRRPQELWPALAELLARRDRGVPAYGELLLEDGRRVVDPYWGRANSCCVWGLTLPGFVPLPDWDAVRAATLDAIIAKPEMHFTNGVCAAIAAVDPWIYPEERALAVLQRIADETERPGRYLPMGGAMPEKLGAPEGDPYHDIRPQGFAMGSWLAAYASLGLRRLPYGLALRPTAVFDRISAYAWRGAVLDLHWGPRGRGLALEIDGRTIGGTLQIPQRPIAGPQAHAVRLVDAAEGILWLRSQVQLDEVAEAGGRRVYRFTAFGLSEIGLSAMPAGAELRDAGGRALACAWSASEGIATCRFIHSGGGELILP